GPVSRTGASERNGFESRFRLPLPTPAQISLLLPPASHPCARRRFSYHRSPRYMYKLVLLRHGQSTWNLENRFTGWTDVDLTEQGRNEARLGGKLMREANFAFDVVYTSVLKRAIRTMFTALDEMDQLWVPVIRDWRLNERHYGALQGLNKAET